MSERSTIVERFNATAPAGRAADDVRVLALPALELLIGLYALTAPEPRPSSESWVPPLGSLSRGLQRAVAGVGRDGGELWLHLIGLPLEGAGMVAELGAALAEIDPVELRRHLVGVHVPAWVSAVGLDALERAAAGDAAAAKAILADDCYYGGQARAALGPVLPLTAAETKKRVLGVVRLFAGEVFAEREPELMRRLADAAAAGTARLVPGDPERSVHEVTGGYRYVREPELRQVVLVPHLAAPPWLLLMQHRDARVIAYAAAQAHGNAEEAIRARLLRLGRALGDEKRIEILRALAEREATMNELAAETGLAKSTVHHHLAQLREAGLITLRGNARGYWYTLSADGRDATISLLGEALGHS